MPEITMTCMTKKEKFTVNDPEVVVLNNGRYAYRAQCPWKGKNDKDLFAYKFCGAQQYNEYRERVASDSEVTTDDTQASE